MRGRNSPHLALLWSFLLATKTFQYVSTERLACAGCLPAEIILCVPVSKVQPPDCPGGESNDYPFSTINATLTVATRAYNSCVCVNQWTYTIEYDDTQLVEDAVILATDLTGVFCVGCLVTWAMQQIGNEIHVDTDDDGNQTLVSQHGCEYPLGDINNRTWDTYVATTSNMQNVTSIAAQSIMFQTKDGITEVIGRIKFTPTVVGTAVTIDLPTQADPVLYAAAGGLVNPSIPAAIATLATTFATTGTVGTSPVSRFAVNAPVGNWDAGATNYLFLNLRYKQA